MTVFEKFIASSCPPANGSVLWVNTSKTPLTLNMQMGGQWQVLGAFYDAEMLQKILEAIGEISVPEHPEIRNISDVVTTILDLLDMPTQAETEAMFVLN